MQTTNNPKEGKRNFTYPPRCRAVKDCAAYAVDGTQRPKHLLAYADDLKVNVVKWRGDGPVAGPVRVGVRKDGNRTILLVVKGSTSDEGDTLGNIPGCILLTEDKRLEVVGDRACTGHRDSLDQREVTGRRFRYLVDGFSLVRVAGADAVQLAERQVFSVPHHTGAL